MFSVFLPRVTEHYNEYQVSNAIDTGLGGEFVSHIHVRLTVDRKGRPFQMMFVHFFDREGNEKTAEFFAALEKGEVKFYTGMTDRLGSPYYWKIRKYKRRTFER